MRGRGLKHFATKLESGRICAPEQGAAKAQVEIGRDGDVSAESLASTVLYSSPSEVLAVQARLLTLTKFPVKAKAYCNRQAQFTYMIRTEEGDELLGALSSQVNFELFKVGDVVRAKNGGGQLRPPDEIWHLHVVGVRTVVLPPDSPQAERLHVPWSASGILLAPVILGYTQLLFRYFRG